MLISTSFRSGHAALMKLQAWGPGERRGEGERLRDVPFLCLDLRLVEPVEPGGPQGDLVAPQSLLELASQIADLDRVVAREPGVELGQAARRVGEQLADRRDASVPVSSPA